MLDEQLHPLQSIANRLGTNHAELEVECYAKTVLTVYLARRNPLASALSVEVREFYELTTGKPFWVLGHWRTVRIEDHNTSNHWLNA
jgi:hypothetical protein